MEQNNQVSTFKKLMAEKVAVPLIWITLGFITAKVLSHNKQKQRKLLP